MDNRYDSIARLRLPFAPHATVHATKHILSLSGGRNVLSTLLTTHQVGVEYAARSFATIDAQGGFSMLVQQHSEVLVEVEVGILTHVLLAYSRACLLTSLLTQFLSTQLLST